MSAEPSTLDQLTLAQLPDDVLVLVMQHLSVDDLLACRLVCKRLGGLALHPDAWRHQRLGEDKPCVCAVLSLAPCLDKVVYSEKAHRACNRAFIKTTCAVRHLLLHINRVADCTRSSSMLRNQEALGRLRSVQVKASSNAPFFLNAPISPPAFVKTLVACSAGLESLDLPGLPMLRRGLVIPGPSKSSLKHFRCELSDEVKTLVNTVLAGHAATLEDVDLGGSISEGWVGADTAALLAGMPRLRKLNCEVFPGMEALAACKTLVDLSIFASARRRLKMNSYLHHHVEGDALKGATKLLRLAGQLRAVSINVDEIVDVDINLELMMQALASSPRPLLERLSITSYDREPGVEEPLVRPLPQLPALRVLGLWGTPLFESRYDDAMDAFLLALTPTTMPALRLLELSAYKYEGCVHRWLHRDSVKSVLTANPLLHIHVPAPSECGECDACAARCHRQVTWGKAVRLGLGVFSHDPDQCPSPEDHTTGFVWIRITTE